MTRIITSVFANVAEAEKAVQRLSRKGLPRGNRQVIRGGETAHADMVRARVHESALKPYGDLLAKGNVVLVVLASYKPLGVARITREILDDLETVSVANSVVQDHPIAWEPEKAPSVLKDHPHMLSFSGVETPGRLSDSFGLPMLKARKPKRNLMSSEKRMSRMFWPMPLLSKKKRSSSVMSGGRQMSKAFWPARLISNKPRRKSVLPSRYPI